MKKNVLILLLLCIILAGCGKKEEPEPEPKPKLTLDKMAELLPDRYGMNEIKCTPLKNYNVVGSLQDKLLLSDGYLYSIGSLFSNNEQCIKAVDMKFTKVLEGGYLLGEDGKLYSTYDYKQNTYAVNISSAGFLNWIEIKLSDAESEVYKSSSNYKNGAYTSIEYKKFFVLKPDGNIYAVIYKIETNHKTQKKTASLTAEKVLYTSTDYGKISNFSVNNSSNKEVNLIISPKGIFYLKTIETEECMKYEDVVCQTKMTEATEYSYNKYKDQIKYYDKNYVVTKNNSILSTNVVFNINDSRKSYERLFVDYEE